MNKTATIQARVEPQLKEKAENVLHKLGMTSTEAIRLFYTQVALHEEIPFKIKMPNPQTRKALDDSRNEKNL